MVPPRRVRVALVLVLLVVVAAVGIVGASAFGAVSLPGGPLRVAGGGVGIPMRPGRPVSWSSITVTNASQRDVRLRDVALDAHGLHVVDVKVHAAAEVAVGEPYPPDAPLSDVDGTLVEPGASVFLVAGVEEDDVRGGDIRGGRVTYSWWGLTFHVPLDGELEACPPSGC